MHNHNHDYSKPADRASLELAKAALEANNMVAYIVKDAAAAKAKALELIPEDSEILTMTSETLLATGLVEEINESGHFNSVRKELMKTPGVPQKKLGAAPTYTIGSVGAITEEGQAVIASNTGSQLPAYAYGSDKVIWVVGAQKVVADVNHGLDRIFGYMLPLESKRAQKAYGVEGSSVNKILIVEKEATPDRIHVILVEEALGY